MMWDCAGNLVGSFEVLGELGGDRIEAIIPSEFEPLTDP